MDIMSRLIVQFSVQIAVWVVTSHTKYSHFLVSADVNNKGRCCGRVHSVADSPTEVSGFYFCFCLTVERVETESVAWPSCRLRFVQGIPKITVE